MMGQFRRKKRRVVKKMKSEGKDECFCVCMGIWDSLSDQKMGV